MNSQLLSAFISKSYSFHFNSQASLLRARTTVGSLSNQILMYYPKREIPLTPALLQRKGNSPTNKQWGEFSAEELRPFFRVLLQNYPFIVMFSILMGHITFPPLPGICEGCCTSQQNHRDKDCHDCCQAELGKCSAPQVWCEKISNCGVRTCQWNCCPVFHTTPPKGFLTWWVIQGGAGSYLFALVLVSAKLLSWETNCQLFYSR